MSEEDQPDLPEPGRRDIDLVDRGLPDGEESPRRAGPRETSSSGREAPLLGPQGDALHLDAAREAAARPGAAGLGRNAPGPGGAVGSGRLSGGDGPCGVPDPRRPAVYGWGDAAPRR